VKYTSHQFADETGTGASVTGMMNAGVSLAGGRIIGVSVTGMMNGRGVSLAATGIGKTTCGESTGAQEARKSARMSGSFFIFPILPDLTQKWEGGNKSNHEEAQRVTKETQSFCVPSKSQGE
jgi:hypothetical protein